MNGNTFLIQEEVAIPQKDYVVVLKKGDRIVVNEQGNMYAPWSLPEISLNKGEPFVISYKYGDPSGDYRVEIQNIRTKESTWLLFDNKKEAILHGWVKE